MPVNCKKTIRLKNRTKYFIADKDKTFVTFSSPYSYQSRSIKIEGYETRLYWQYRYCEENNGQTFFYTLTYNDAHLPKHYGVNCFDYEDLRDLLTGGFRKKLLRKYGTKFKYFCGAELGDGKGERGMHNNPHYHFLFFLEDAHNPRFPYVKIDPEEFRHLIRIYWQGFDEDEGRQDYQTAKYGIVKEGENIGKVTDFRAEEYVSKYVCKDAKLKMAETKIESYVRLTEYEKTKWNSDFYRAYFDDIIKPMFNIPLNASQTKWKYTDAELMKQLCDFDILPFSVFEEFDGHTEPDPTDYIEFVKLCNKQYGLYPKFNDYRNHYLNDKVHTAITEWRNRFCNKCRISQGVGDYALQFVDDLLDPRFEVPGKKGPKQRPMPLYYYRKLFTELYHPEEKTFSGKVIKYPAVRILNQAGIDYKVHRLGKQLIKKIYQAKNNLSLVLGDPELFETMRQSDINTRVFYHYDEFFRRYNYLLNEENKNELYERYAEYKLIYEDRYYDVRNGHPDICPSADYERFIQPSVLMTRRSETLLDSFLNDTVEDDEDCDLDFDLDFDYITGRLKSENKTIKRNRYENYLSYGDHPYFLRYAGLFGVLDLCADYFFVQKDNRSQKQAEEIAETKRFHTERNLREFYAQFGL